MHIPVNQAPVAWANGMVEEVGYRALVRFQACTGTGSRSRFLPSRSFFRIGLGDRVPSTWVCPSSRGLAVFSSRYG
jgi:hypothetical protein